MDQNSTNGTDKRNWRERLGIGTKEMPRISEEFNPAPAAPKASAPSVKPAPMAPRVAPKPTIAPQPRPAAVAARPAAPMDTDALASKLKMQRDAAEKLAEQRVQAARQRAEAINVGSPVGSAKPKFTFAEEETRSQPQPAAMPPRAQMPPPQQVRPAVLQQQSVAPQMAPPRPPLGGGAIPQRAPNPGFQPRPQMQQPLPPPVPPGYPPAYNPNLGYRPIDPNTGYAPQPQYNPNPGFAPPPRQPQNYAPQPRLQVPPRNPPASDYGYNPGPRLTNPAARPMPQPQYGEADQDDIFEQPAPRTTRRATANDYQQAYREVESGYEEETPKSRGPLILLSLLALALVVGFGSVWAYNNYVKPRSSIVSTGADQVPVVKAPETPAKVTTDNANPDAQPGSAASPSKKQIYDRIVGDREVLGGQIVPTEVTPVQPANNSQPVPVPDANTGTGSDGTPLPLPPPPGGTGQQGSIEPSEKSDQDVVNITPAAGASQAADSTSGQTISPLANASPAIPEPPVQGEQIASAAAEKSSEPSSLATSSELATPTKVPVKKIVQPKPPADKKVDDPKMVKSLGSKPVVLVPPAKKVASANTNKTVVTAPQANADGGLYGDDLGSGGNVPVAEPIVPQKRKSLFDLFKGDNAQTAAIQPQNVAQPELLPPRTKVALNEPVQAAPTTSAYVAQLASFKTKSEATQEYKNLSAKHGAIISRYAPIISEGQVAGTTRYRLNIGPMASADVATGVCQSLFAAGERDCLVRRQ
jgi:hypothetical protein